MEQYFDVRLTKEERDCAVQQLGARLKEIEFLTSQYMKEGNKDQVKHLLALEDRIKSAQEKMLKATKA